MAFVFGTAACSLYYHQSTSYCYPTLHHPLSSLIFATQALRNSPWGIVCVFAATGSLGFLLGPILNAYLHPYQRQPAHHYGIRRYSSDLFWFNHLCLY